MTEPFSPGHVEKFSLVPLAELLTGRNFKLNKFHERWRREVFLFIKRGFLDRQEYFTQEAFFKRMKVLIKYSSNAEVEYQG